MSTHLFAITTASPEDSVAKTAATKAIELTWSPLPESVCIMETSSSVKGDHFLIGKMYSRSREVLPLAEEPVGFVSGR